MSTWYEWVFSGIGGTIIGGGVAWFFNWMRQDALRAENIDLKSKLPETFYGPADILRSLVALMEETKSKYHESWAIMRMLPVEFTESIFNKPSSSTIAELNKYRSLVEEIVVEGASGKNYWDFTIYGSSSYSQKVTDATIKFIEEVYFGGETIPDTSWLGIEKSQNSVGFFALGKTERGKDDFQADSTVIISINPDNGVPISSFVIKDQVFFIHVIKPWFDCVWAY